MQVLINCGVLLIIIATIVCAVSFLQYFSLFIRRRWTVRIKLPDPVGFADPISIAENTPLTLRISCSDEVELIFFRCGHQGFEQTHKFTTSPGTQSSLMGRWTGFDWSPSITIPSCTLRPGLYYIKIRSRNINNPVWRAPLIVSAASRQPVIVVASTNSWNAYNHFGGLSNYTYGGIPYPLAVFDKVLRLTSFRWRIGDRHWFPIIPLPEKRPNLAVHEDLASITSSEPQSLSHLMRGEANLITLLERDGIDYSIVSDRDYVERVSLTGVKLVVFNTHPEYWSEETLGRLQETLNAAVNVAVFGGNTGYRQVQLLKDAIAVTCQATKQGPIARIVGLYYNALGYNSRAGFRTLRPLHWCFEGLELRMGDVWGEAAGASGYETDKICGGSTDIDVLAVGTNAEGPAYLVCRKHPSGAFLINAGSVAFTDGLLRDAHLSAIVANVIHRALGPTSNTPP